MGELADSPTIFQGLDRLTGAPARFNAGTGLGGMSKISPIPNGVVDRPLVKRQESSPPGLGSDTDNLPTAAARAAELVNGAHVASAVSSVQGPRAPQPQYSSNVPQSSRIAPPRPLVSATRPPPQPPTAKNDVTPSSDDLRSRLKATGPPGSNNLAPLRKETTPAQTALQQAQTRQQEQREREREQQQRQIEQKQQRQEEQRQQDQWQRQQDEQQQRQEPQPQPRQPSPYKQQEQQQPRPTMGAPSKSSPANTNAATQPASGPAGALEGPPPVMPLQPKKVQIQAQEKPPKPAPAGGVAAAAAALEKPKEKEKRISTMTEVQIMEKLRQVVCDDDPKLIYSKIKKVGQGWVILILPCSSSLFSFNGRLMAVNFV
jgi:hypothetical protein